MKISFDYSLFGATDRYLECLKKNAEIIGKNEYELVLHVDQSVDINNLAGLIDGGAKLVAHHNKSMTIAEGMMLRYGSILSGYSDISLLRDADSLITEREIKIIKHWIQSKYTYHVIRDSQHHTMPIMGGLFGVKRLGFNLCRVQINKYLEGYKRGYGWDQLFLADRVYPHIKKDLIVYTSSCAYMGETICNILPTDTSFIGSYYGKQSQLTSDGGVFTLFYFLSKILRFRLYSKIKVNKWIFVKRLT